MSQKEVILSIKVLIKDNAGNYLILRRSQRSKGNPGKWDLPGGKINDGEGYVEAVDREVKEETGLNVVLKTAMGTAHRETATKRIVYLILEGEIDSGKIKLSEEHDAFAWAGPNELVSYDFPVIFNKVLEGLGDNKAESNRS